MNSTLFGKLFALSVHGQVYAQPLYVPGVAIPGQGRHNVVYVATENDSLYAFDADIGGAPQWKVTLLPNGGTAVPSSDVVALDINPVIGITGTPAIDPSTNTLYVVAKSLERELSCNGYMLLTSHPAPRNFPVLLSSRHLCPARGAEAPREHRHSAASGRISGQACCC